MRILSLETSGRTGSVALLDATAGTPDLLAERPLPPEQRTARSLLPAVRALLREHGSTVADIDLIATTTGPGSFTGLRIGVVAAKTLAYATGVKLIGVHTLTAMAQRASEFCGDLVPAKFWVVLDAQRHELFAAAFNLATPIVEQSGPTTEILTIEQWIARLSHGDAVAGPPLAKLQSSVPAGVTILDESHWGPTAAAAGRVGLAMFERGFTVDPLALVPDYFRRSAAEEKSARFA